jgi:hypothetical protein
MLFGRLPRERYNSHEVGSVISFRPEILLLPRSDASGREATLGTLEGSI